MSRRNSKRKVRYLEISGYSNYRVGDDGSVWSKARTGIWRPLKKTISNRGYELVGLYADGRSRQFFVHKLVLSAFREPCPPGLQCRHLDGNPANNLLTNITWGTPKENADDRTAHGRSPIGSKHALARLKETDAASILNRIAAGEKHSEIASDYGIDKSLISHIGCRRIWRHVSGPKINVTPKCKITESDVIEIRKMAASGSGLPPICERFKISRGAASMIVNRRRWKHVA